LFLNIFASSDVNRTSVKVSLQQRDLPLTINISFNGCEWKKLNYAEKTLDQDVLDRRLSLDGISLIKISVRDL